MRNFLALMGLIGLTACGGFRDDLAQAPDPLGTFRLGHNVVYVSEPVQGPFSRTVTDDEWQAAVVTAVEARLGEARYFGDKYLENGNDYKIINSNLVNGYRIDNINDTIKYLHNFI